MHQIRRLLDILAEHDREAIDHLCGLRRVGGVGTAEKCESLARSYRGDHERFFKDLRQEDLVALLGRPTKIRGERFYLPSSSAYPTSRLVRFAVQVFREDLRPRQFERVSDEREHDENEGEDGEGREDGTAVGADLSGLAEVDLLGDVSASVAKRSPKLLEWLAPAADLSLEELTDLLEEAHGNTLLRNVLQESWPIEVPDGAAAALATLRVSAMHRAPALIEWVARLTRSTYEEVRLKVQIASGNTFLRTVFPALTRKQRRRESETAPPPALAAGQIVAGRWEVRQKIAEGGFGAVFEARDTKRSSGRPVVLKASWNAKGAELLRKEYEIGERLRHQNICMYREIHEDPSGNVVAVLDHGGRSLDQIIEARGPFSVPNVVDVTTQLARALDYMHRHKVMHQDVKPHNVLVQELDGGWEVRLADFGVSILGRTDLRTDGAKTVVASEVVGYSRSYAAPEQRQGIPKRTSDQYSLALVACSMLEGQVFREVNYQPPHFPQLLAGQNAALARALSPDWADRFESCADFARSLGGQP